MEAAICVSISEVLRGRTRTAVRFLALLWMLAWMCGAFVMRLDAADAAKKKGTSAPHSAKEAPPKPRTPRLITVEALAEADQREETELVRMKAEKGDMAAHFDMSLRYGEGYGVERDPQASVMWLRKAAEGGYAPAQAQLAVWYSRGTFVKQDWEQAYQWSLKAAEGGSREGMYNVAWAYTNGQGVAADPEKMLYWYAKSAEAGYLPAQRQLALICVTGKYGAGVDREAACKWFAMGADQDDASCLYFLGIAYYRGEGVPEKKDVAARLWQRAAEQGHAGAQGKLAACYHGGRGIVQDLEEACFWFKLAAKQGDKEAADIVDDLMQTLTRKQIAFVNSRVAEFKPRPPRPMVKKPGPDAPPKPGSPLEDEEGIATGTGFFITQSGYLATNYHVIKGAKDIKVLIAGKKSVHATMVARDENADLAILKIKDDVHPCLPIISSNDVKLGASVATVGFPNPDIQGVAPKLARGDIASLAGIQDDPTCFQISVPLQPGNSGGALVDAKGNVVGVVCAILNQDIVLATTGTLANSVGYAVKSSLLLKLAESVPYLVEDLKHYRAETEPWPFEDIVARAQCATVLIVVELGK